MRFWRRPVVSAVRPLPHVRGLMTADEAEDIALNAFFLGTVPCWTEGAEVADLLWLDPLTDMDIFSRRPSEILQDLEDSRE